MRWLLGSLAIGVALAWSVFEARGTAVPAEAPVSRPGVAAGVSTSLFDDQVADAILARLELAAEAVPAGDAPR